MRVPCLVIKGDRSHPVLTRIADRLAEGLPGAELVELRGSGHVTYAEQPAAFADAIRVFAARLHRNIPVAGGASQPEAIAS